MSSLFRLPRMRVPTVVPGPHPRDTVLELLSASTPHFLSCSCAEPAPDMRIAKTYVNPIGVVYGLRAAVVVCPVSLMLF